MAQFIYLEKNITKQYLIQEEIKNRFNYDNACYHSVQNHLPSRLLSENKKLEFTKL
jgi:hypothetical protein